MPEEITNSVVIPVFNEKETLGETYKRLTAVMEGLNRGYEVIFVDDGSRDRSFEFLKGLCRRDRRIKIVKFSKNFGHHIALTAGIDCASGEAVILMDGDLQDPPEEIPKLYKKFKEGYDIVYARRKQGSDTFSKRLFSKLFYMVFRVSTGLNIPPDTGIFRVVSRRVADVLRACRERPQFISGLISRTGFPFACVDTRREARLKGKTKYTFFKSCRLAIGGLFSFSRIPLGAHIAKTCAGVRSEPMYTIEEKIGFDRRPSR